IAELLRARISRDHSREMLRQRDADLAIAAAGIPHAFARARACGDPVEQGRRIVWPCIAVERGVAGKVILEVHCRIFRVKGCKADRDDSAPGIVSSTRM